MQLTSLATETATRPPIEPADIVFVLCIEKTAIEPQGLLLIESIREFGGCYARSPIVALSPRPELAITGRSHARLAELDVAYVSAPLNRTRSAYLPTNRIVAGAWAEQNLTSEYIVVLDSDTLFVGEPAFVHADAGVRPVDVKGSTSSGPSDPLDAYWQRIAGLAGLPVEALPMIRTTVDGVLIRASYNAGFTVVRRASGILSKTSSIFHDSLREDLRPLRGRAIDVYASTGHVGAEASEFWGSSQAALSMAICACANDAVLYDDRYNIPLHHLEFGAGRPLPWPAGDPILVHYHWLTMPQHRQALIGRLAALGARSTVVAWLERRLRMEQPAGLLHRAAVLFRAGGTAEWPSRHRTRSAQRSLHGKRREAPLENSLTLGGVVRSSGTYGADYLEEMQRILLTHVTPVTRSFLEWGSGHTTLLILGMRSRLSLDYFASIDDNQEYQALVVAQAPVWDGFHPFTADLTGPRRSDRDPEPNYATLPLDLGRTFDFIFIDGRRRLECALTAALLCHPQSVVVLHDYRRARYRSVKSLFEVVEDGPQFRVMRSKGRRSHG